ncbi:VanZ family protein [Lentzea flaviverrucosa]|uniref:VanZ like family protein n=1 Tax=Lentzea flaviverrucosa TaxID=200379 RepID=A0A1H9D2X7_9PSEU|nr:VanZ family protein [Lentzea flaviverrucosa]RDI24713.1 VanZ like protein [Lentzea flaviverrucosa]SEQ07193.1 VanZ like family protein [Lentzea flaviverrucosa]
MLNTWQEWVGTETGVVVGAVLGIPVAVLAMLLLALYRKLVENPHPWRTALADVGMVYGTLPWVWLIMLPGAEPGTAGELSLVPFADLIDLVEHRDAGQIVGNMLVFAALGSFAPLRFAALRSVWRVLAFAAACSALLEIAQFVLRLDRVSSVDDVLLNAVGAALASLLSRWWWRPKPAPVEERHLVAV